MTNRKLLSVSLTILLAVAMLALAAPAVSAQDQGDGSVATSLGLADGDITNTGEVLTYQQTVSDADTGDSPVSVSQAGGINVSVEPAEVVSGPGGVNTYEVVVYNATGGIEGYDNTRIFIEEDGVGQFISFDETRESDFSRTEIRNRNGTNVSQGPVFFLESALAGNTFEGSDRIVLATVDIEATGSIDDSTAVRVDPNPEGDNEGPDLQNLNSNEYPVDTTIDSQFTISFDMNLTFNDQQVAPGDTVTVENVESDGENARVLVTYENDAGDLIVAGTTTGNFSGEDVTVDIGDTGGLSGTHTAHILPESGSSSDYEPGDVVSADTAGSIIAQDSASVSDFDMNVAFNDQSLANGGMVSLANVDSDGANAAVIVTYENQAGELVIAGLESGEFAGENTMVNILDLGGVEGSHTAHILPASRLSSDYSVGDTVSGDTAAEILDQDSAVVSDFDMNVEFATNDDGVVIVEGDQVTLENVQSVGETAATIVTYTNDAGDLVIAGLTVGQFANDNVEVVLQDTGGLTANGSLADGEHTAHIIPVSRLSSDYEAGDIVSDATAGGIIDQDTERVVDPPLPSLEGNDIAVFDSGFTIGGDYPVNQRDLFETAGGLYGLAQANGSQVPLPDSADTDGEAFDERYSPLASGQHAGLGGLPIQDDVYRWLDVDATQYPIDPRGGTLLNWQNDAPTQSVAVSFDQAFDSAILDYTEALDHGLELDPANLEIGETQNVSPDDVDLNIITETQETPGDEASDVLITLDTSGSMAGSKLANAKEGAKTLVDTLGEGTSVGLVEFNNNGSVVSPLGSDKADVKAAIDGLTAGGGTNMSGGINATQSELDANGTSSEQFMIVLADGGANSGSATRAAAADVRNVTDLNAEGDGSQVISIAYGNGADENLMEDISSPAKVDDGQIDDQDANAFDATQDDIDEVFGEAGGIIASQAGQLEIEITGPVSGNPTVGLNMVWKAVDPVEGLDVNEPNGIDYETDHRLILPNGDEEIDNFVTFEAGATGISIEDTDNDNDGFLNESVQDTELEALIESEGAASGTANDGSFLVWEDQRVTFDTGTRGHTVDIYEIGTTTVNVNGTEELRYSLGQKIDDSVGLDDTAPGQVSNLNTSNLTAGEQYFVTLGPDKRDAVVLDVRSLDLGVNTKDTVAFQNQTQPLQVNATSDDTTGGQVEAWFHFNGTEVEDVVHVERGLLTGNGNRTLEVIPSENPTDPASQVGDNLDLVGPGDYTVSLLHTESGVVSQTSFTILPPPPGPTLVEADDVVIESPDLTDPAEPANFDRGDIIEIELTLQGGNVATVSFGNESDQRQNLQVHATLYDPTWSVGDGPTTITAYLNTYQIGHGTVEDGSGGFTANQPNWITTFSDRQHGFFTDPSDPTAALLNPAQFPSKVDRAGITNTFAGEQIDIYGGSQGGAVLSAGEENADGEFPGLRYDLHAAGNFSPHTEDMVERDDVNALDIEQRSTDMFQYWKAPGEGVNQLDLTSTTQVNDIEALANQGVITPLDVEVNETSGEFIINDSIAEGDYIIVQADSTGLEGVMKEAIDRNPSMLSTASFLAAYEDTTPDFFTDEFTTAMSELLPRYNDPLLQFGFGLSEDQRTYLERIQDADPNEELVVPNPVNPNLDLEGVLADENTEGNLAEFYMPYQFDSSDPSLPSAADPLTIDGTPGNSIVFNGSVVLEPTGGEQQNVGTTFGDRNVPRDVNPALAKNSDGFNPNFPEGTNFLTNDTTGLEYTSPQFFINPRHLGPNGIEVPGEPAYTFDGTTTMAPGTTVTMEMLSLTGEGTPFFKELPGDAPEAEIVVESSPGDALPTWEVTVDFDQTRDNVSIQGGTQFTTDIERAGPSSGIADTSIPGVVLADPVSADNLTFELNDQRSDGNVVTVEAFQANRIAQITILQNGTEIGQSDVLDRTLHEQFNIVLDDPIESNSQVTAEVTIVQPEVGETLATETAVITVEDEQAPFFRVSDLSPPSATVEVGDEVTVEATVTNDGDIEATQTIELTVGGESFEETVTLAGGASQTVTFPTLDTSALGAGDYQHTVSSVNTSVSGALTVEEPPEPPAPAEFSIVTLSPSDANVTQGDEVVVDITVQNVGEQEATQDVTLNVSGLGQVGGESLTLAGSDTGTVTFTVPTGEVAAGDYTHTAFTDNDSVEGSLVITAPPEPPSDDSADGNTSDSMDDSMDDSADGSADDNTTDNESGDGADGSGAGFGIVVAALALLGAALLAMRRRVE